LLKKGGFTGRATSKPGVLQRRNKPKTGPPYMGRLGGDESDTMETKLYKKKATGEKMLPGPEGKSNYVAEKSFVVEKSINFVIV